MECSAGFDSRSSGGFAPRDPCPLGRDELGLCEENAVAVRRIEERLEGVGGS